METYNCTITKLDKDECEKRHTKQLLNTLRQLRVNSLDCLGACTHYKECNSAHKYNFNLIKQILSTREHILNKQESKRLRKERIKQGV